jgi:phosphate transport system substrate-binding protein
MKSIRLMKLMAILLAVVSATILSTAGLQAAGKTTISLKGSDTMLPLGQRWAEAFMAQNPNVVIQVTGGGSGVGIAALINGSTDICQASRSIKSAEIDKLKERFNSPGVEIAVARDGLAVYMNEKNPVTELNMEQLRAIYIGEVTNWKDVGGPDAQIILYGRENSSGTYSFFKDNVLMGEDFAAQTQTLPGTAAIVNAIAKDKNGIGYGGAAYAKGVRDCKIKKDDKSAGYLPTEDNIKAGTYALSRHLFWYMTSKPTGDMKKLIDYALSEIGQKVVKEVGYFPVK